MAGGFCPPIPTILGRLGGLAVVQTEYYVDATDGMDGAAGTEVAPWKTIGKVNGEVFNAGDTVYFKRGEVWTDAILTVPSDDMNFAAYDVGDKPIFDCEDTRAYGVREGSADGATFTDIRVIDATDVGFGIFRATGVGGNNYVLTDCEVAGCAQKAVTFNSNDNSNQITGHVIGGTYEDNGGGITVAEGAAILVQSATIRNNTLPGYGGDGVNTGSNTTGITVEYCTIYGNSNSGGDGVQVATGTTGAVIRWNVIYGNENADIIFADTTNSSDAIVYYNLLGQATGNAKYGLYLRVTDAAVLNNTIAGLYNEGTGAGLFISTVNTGDTCTVKNNIIASESDKCLAVASGILGTVVLDNNCYYNPGNTIVEFEGSSYTAIATYQAAEPTQDQVSLGADPLFISTTDRHLQDASPCRDSGAMHAIVLDLDGEMVPKNVETDMGCYEMDAVAVPVGPLDWQQIIRSIYDGSTLLTLNTGAASGSEGESPLDAEQIWQCSYDVTEGKLRVVR